jgi:hypothetical protein
MSYTPRKIGAWFEVSQKNYRRELLDRFFVTRTAQHGDKKDCNKLMKALK